MPHYKDQNNQLHYLDSTTFEYLLPAGCVAISDAEADALRAAAITLPDSAAAKTAAINAACGAAILAGFDSSALGATYHYTATLEDQANLLGLIAIGAGGDFTCVDAAGVKARRAHTAAQLKKVLADGGIFKDQLLAKARALKDAVAAAVDVAAVDAVVW